MWLSYPSCPLHKSAGFWSWFAELRKETRHEHNSRLGDAAWDADVLVAITLAEEVNSWRNANTLKLRKVLDDDQNSEIQEFVLWRCCHVDSVRRDEFLSYLLYTDLVWDDRNERCIFNVPSTGRKNSPYFETKLDWDRESVGMCDVRISQIVQVGACGIRNALRWIEGSGVSPPSEQSNHTGKSWSDGQTDRISTISLEIVNLKLYE